MNTGEEKFARTEPFEGVNDVDRLGKEAGIEMLDGEELNLETKLEKRDESRLDLAPDEEKEQTTR